MLFNVLIDNFVITHSRGVFHQRKVYRRGDAVYVGCGGGFARLTKNGCSAPNMGIDEKIFTFEPETDSLGYMKLPKDFDKNNNKKGE